MRTPLPRSAPAPLTELNSFKELSQIDRRDSVSTSTLPRTRGRISGYCWDERPGTHVHCCLPHGHHGTHWHPYSKTGW